MKRTIAMAVALGLVGAIGCDTGETKKAEPKADAPKPDAPTPETKDVAPPPDTKPEPEPAKPERPNLDRIAPPVT